MLVYLGASEYFMIKKCGVDIYIYISIIWSMSIY